MTNKVTANISSMTGFSRQSGVTAVGEFVWELKSVNGRGLEMRFRMPSGFDQLEQECRRVASETFTRGNFNFNLVVTEERSAASYGVNAGNLHAAIEAARRVSEQLPCDGVRPEGILGLRGVWEQDAAPVSEEEKAALVVAALDGFKAGVAALASARKAEGGQMGAILVAQVDRIEDLTKAAAEAAADAQSLFAARLKQQLDELLPEGKISDDRIVQEAALLAVRADVREELDRLVAHIEAARSLLVETGAIGRRLDFLTQEFNREANTLCSKAPDISLKQIGLDLKSVIDQMREQVQNIE